MSSAGIKARAATIVIDALLLGQRVTLTTGHTFVFEEGRLWVIAKQGTLALTDWDNADEVLLGANDMTFAWVVAQAQRLSAEELAVIAAETAMKKMANERVRG